MNNLKFYVNYCQKQQNEQKLRKLSAPDNNHKKYIDFSNNDYLQLSRSEILLAAARHYGELYGVGSTGSRLLSGNSDVFSNLETQIAKDKNTEAALIFNSGYQANIGVISSLCDSKVLNQQALVFFDKANHASLYQGIFLCGAKLIRYRHNNMEDLKNLLESYSQDSRSKFIVSETLFSMDGDTADLSILVSLAYEYRALLYLDEAHSTGILGQGGYGLSTTLNMSHISSVIMGTFSKGVGVCGAYIACSQQIKDYLINKCASFIYSTSLSPMIIGAVTKGWTLIKELEQERKSLLQKSNMLRTNLEELGLDVGRSSTHIVPIILKKESLVLDLWQHLKKHDILVSAIRPPTVSPGNARIRLSLNISHSDHELSVLINCLKDYF